MALALIGPLLAGVGVDVALVAGAILFARVALYSHSFLRRGL